MVAFPETNSLIMSDHFANVKRVEALIRTLDSTPLRRAQGAAPASGNAEPEH
jgi:type II secretory pathway component GspD/PulD (secretin)